MTPEDFKPNDRVAYVPHEAHGNVNHPNVQRGTVSSINKSFVFVRFDKTVARLGWEGTTSQSCRPDDLVKE